MQSLKDKLLKAGLVSEEQAKKVEEEAARKKDRPRGAGGGSGDRAHHEARGRDERPRRDDRPHGARGEFGDRPHHDRPRFEGRGRDERRGPPEHRRPEGPAITVRRQPLRSGSEGAPIPKLPPMPGSKAAQRLESKKQLELERKLRELVTTNQVAVEAGEHTFYFVTRKNRLRRLELSEEQAKKLESGELAVVERPEPSQIEHSLVPPAVAEEMGKLSAKAVRFLNKPGAQVGFLSEDEIRSREEHEKSAAPEAPQNEEERHAEERAEAEAAEASEAAPAEATGVEPGPEATAAPASGPETNGETPAS